MIVPTWHGGSNNWMGFIRESRQASRGRGGRNIRVGREIDSTRGTGLSDNENVQ